MGGKTGVCMKSDFSRGTFAIMREKTSDMDDGDRNGFTKVHIRRARDGESGGGFGTVTRPVATGVPSRVVSSGTTPSPHDGCPARGAQVIFPLLLEVDSALSL